MKITAPQLLNKAATIMENRSKQYDKPDGERSMGRTVAAFNIVTGRDLRESEGWLLLQLLKDVRDRQTQAPHEDSLEDCIAYAALKAEARLLEPLLLARVKQCAVAEQVEPHCSGKVIN